MFSADLGWTNEVIDAAASGKPGTIVEKAIAVVTVAAISTDALGNHSGTVKKSGMQQDHTKTGSAIPKPVSKSEKELRLPSKPEPQPTLKQANASGY